MLQRIKAGFNYLLVQIIIVFRPFLGDQIYLKLIFRRLVGYNLNLDDPKSYNEKLQWLKLYDKNPLYTTLVDKDLVKDYVAHLIGAEYIIPTYGVWENPNQIEWNKLPDEFILKTTQGGGCEGVVICRNKENFDKKKAINKLKKALKQDLYKKLLEWPYRNVQRKIIAEKLLAGEDGKAPRDYKIYCFNGVPKVMVIATERFCVSHAYFDYFDMNGNHLPITQGDINNPVMPQIPQNFDEMKKIAAKLSQGIPQVRVDLYSVENKVYFGELTLFDSSGFAKFTPVEWDYIWGDWIMLPLN